MRHTRTQEVRPTRFSHIIKKEKCSLLFLLLLFVVRGDSHQRDEKRNILKEKPKIESHRFVSTEKFSDRSLLIILSTCNMIIKQILTRFVDLFSLHVPFIEKIGQWDFRNITKIFSPFVKMVISNQNKMTTRECKFDYELVQLHSSE